MELIDEKEMLEQAVRSLIDPYLTTVPHPHWRGKWVARLGSPHSSVM